MDKMQLNSDYFEKLWLSDNQKKEPTADFWDFRAEEYNKSHTAMATVISLEEKVQELRDKGVINHDSTVLDIGCGSGQFAVALGKVVNKVVALDFSRNMLTHARENAEKAHLTNIDFVQSDWDSFQSEQRFDLVIASMSPAIHTPAQLAKMLDFCQGYGYLSAFVERHSALKEQLYALTDQAYVRQFNKLNYIFNLLWTKGLYPELTYEVGLQKRVFTLEKAKELYPRELAVMAEPAQIAAIHRHLETAAENDEIIEVLQQRKGELIWKMA